MNGRLSETLRHRGDGRGRRRRFVNRGIARRIDSVVPVAARGGREIV